MIPRIETRTRLMLIMHRTELIKTTNTGRLAAACLVNSEVLVRGRHAAPSEAIHIAPGSQPVLLYPAEDAVPLAELAPLLASTGQSVTLIVPDGNWRQASKVRGRVPGLARVPCAILPAGTPSIYRLRAEAHPAGLATIEAVARAMGILEGPEVERALDLPFRAMVERTLWSRGSIAAHDVAGGIPARTLRHDPLTPAT
jgi:DTW domain-containing protein YfiP